MSRFLWKTVVMGLAAGVVVGCATAMNVSSHVERGVDFRAFRTYQWGPADALPTGDPRLDRNPYFKDLVQGAVERQMAGHGLVFRDQGRTDLLVHMHANVTDRVDPNRLDEWCGYTEGIAKDMTYEAGTIVIDVIDATSGRLIWRGWAQTSVAQMLTDRDRMRETIEAAVARMFNQWPAL